MRRIRRCDPIHDKERLAFYAAAYAGGEIQTMSRPCWDLRGMPPSPAVFARRGRVMLDDARLLRKKLTAAEAVKAGYMWRHVWHAMCFTVCPGTRGDL